MWGRVIIENAQSGQDATKNLTFPEAFDNVPTVSVTCAGWIAIRAVFCNGTSKTGTTLGAMQAQGRTLNIHLDWIAIG